MSKIDNGLPFWVKFGGKSTPPPPPIPTPLDKAGALWGFTARSGVSRVGTVVSQVNDPTGNARHTVFGSGKEATYVASHINGRPAIKTLATSLGDFGLDALWASGQARGFYALIQNTAEGSPYYHTFFSMRTAVVGVNFNFVYSTDPSYGFFFGLTTVAPGALLPLITSPVDITSDGAAMIINWDGVDGQNPSSFAAYYNNASQTLASGTGGNTNSGSNNYVNSYGNLGAPAFPATDCFIMEAFLYDTPISGAERAAIFKPFTEGYYGITQS